MAGVAKATIVDLASFADLFPALHKRGFEVVGPTVRDGAIVYEAISRLEDLPVGLTDAQERGRYRLTPSNDGALFGFRCGPQSWKKFLHPADIRLFNADQAPRYAFLGVRACELAAILIQDRVLAEDRFPDLIYQARRRSAFIIAVNCTEASPVCFCESLGTGPHAEADFDLAITERIEDGHHEFEIEAGSDSGAQVLGELNGREAPVRNNGASLNQTRRVDTNQLREILFDNFEHPRWDEVAQRCLACGNCTMVCPTCFCTTVEDVSDVTGTHSERLRKWDSCFTLAFSYIHGGSVRASVKSRYRQWLTHKFSTWYNQFGSCGCVGCGRCITWCPAGIDITEELRVIRDSAALRTLPKEEQHGVVGTHS